MTLISSGQNRAPGQHRVAYKFTQDKTGHCTGVVLLLHSDIKQRISTNI